MARVDFYYLAKAVQTDFLPECAHQRNRRAKGQTGTRPRAESTLPTLFAWLWPDR